MLTKLLMLIIFHGIPILVAILGYHNYYCDYFTSVFEYDVPDKRVYDFIIVGAGSAGATLAHRLSKNSKVLLLEAGGDPTYLNSIPGLTMELLGHPATDWLYQTVPQKHACFGFYNNASNWPRGKVLGGSSSLNYMFYLRGHPLDYDNWANLTEDQDWSYNNVVPYFKKSIVSYKGKFKGNSKHYEESAYGFLHVENREWTPLYKEFINAGKEVLGLHEIDVNGPQESGFGVLEVTQNRGSRWGTYASIIELSKNLRNVKICRYCQTTKIQIDKSKRATGVWYLRHGVKTFARATKEVIISAGSIDSPKLLMLSGIGPKQHLQSVGIKPRIDLPVGKNLHDHAMAILLPFLINKPVSFIPDRDFGIGVLLEYLFHGQGALTAPNGVIAQGFLSSNKVRESGRDWPDLQLYFTPVGVYETMPASFARAGNLRPEIAAQVLTPHVGKDSLLISAALVRPKSRGQVTLRDKNPLSQPLIDPNYLGHPDDLPALVEGVKLAVKLMEEAKPFKELQSQLPLKSIPGCEMHKIRSDSYWECYIRHLLMTVWHPVGTCRMGQKHNKESIVDTKLRVVGTTGLRVIDASVMPVIVNANTNAPTIMIAEKGADFIREYWSNQFAVCDLLEHLKYTDYKRCYYTMLL